MVQLFLNKNFVTRELKKNHHYYSHLKFGKAARNHIIKIHSYHFDNTHRFYEKFHHSPRQYLIFYVLYIFSRAPPKNFYTRSCPRVREPSARAISPPHPIKKPLHTHSPSQFSRSRISSLLPPPAGPQFIFSPRAHSRRRLHKLALLRAQLAQLALDSINCRGSFAQVKPSYRNGERKRKRARVLIYMRIYACM